MVLNIVIIALIFLAGLIGYAKGFFKELYNLIALILAALLAYFLRDFFVDFLFSNISLGDIPESISNIVKEVISPFLMSVILFINIFLLIRITVFILIKTNVLPDEKKYRLLGSLINVVITTFFLTFMIFPFSFTSLLENDLSKYDLYSDSNLSQLLLSANPPLKNLSDDIKKLYVSGIELAKSFQTIDSIDDLSDDQIDIIKEFAKNSKVAEELVVEASKPLFDKIKEEGVELNFGDVPFDELDEAFKEGEYYDTLKELYDENIITDSMITRIIEENDIQGINSEDIINLFK